MTMPRATACCVVLGVSAACGTLGFLAQLPEGILTIDRFHWAAVTLEGVSMMSPGRRPHREPID
jgi:hypothetical protein